MGRMNAPTTIHRTSPRHRSLVVNHTTHEADILAHGNGAINIQDNPLIPYDLLYNPRVCY